VILLTFPSLDRNIVETEFLPVFSFYRALLLVSFFDIVLIRLDSMLVLEAISSRIAFRSSISHLNQYFIAVNGLVMSLGKFSRVSFTSVFYGCLKRRKLSN